MSEHADRWAADPEHKELARQVEGYLGMRLFEKVADLPDRFQRGMEWEDLTEHEDPWERGLYDPHVWPVVYVDDQGRRLEVTVDVSVRPLPPVEVQAARHRAQVELVQATLRRKGTSPDIVDQVPSALREARDR